MKEALEKHWDEAIRVETEQDDTTLLSAYDAAYVAQLEAERGPITIEEHAQLLGSAGRKGSGPALHGLPSEGILRIKRAGLRRMSTDRDFAAGLGRALAGAKR